MICVECMGDKQKEEIRATFMNMDEQVTAFCVCEECACNPPRYETLKYIN